MLGDLSFGNQLLVGLLIGCRLAKANFFRWGVVSYSLKFVMSSLPVYFLSFFKALAGIISSFESLFSIFFFLGEVRILGKSHG